MILLLDVGSSTIKWVCTDGSLLSLPSNSFVYKVEDVSAQLQRAWDPLTKPDQVFVASVASQEVNIAVANWIRRCWQLEPDFISSPQNSGELRNGYFDPASLGIDRWLGVLAASSYSVFPFAVFDCGTCLTTDVVASDRQHLGGLITPGLWLMQQSIAEHTAINYLVDPGKGFEPCLFATTTEAGIRAGTLAMATSHLQALADHLRQRFGNELTCYLTGGEATHFCSYLADDFVVKPDLVLEGLLLATKK